MPLPPLPTATPVQPPGLAGAQVEWLKWPSGGPGRGDSGSRWGKSRATPGRGKDSWYLRTEGRPHRTHGALGSDHGKVPAGAGL